MSTATIPNGSCPDDVRIRRFTDRDIGFAFAQTAREGWSTARWMFELHLEHDPDGGFVARTAGGALG